MKERPILFSAPMVRAILAGTKTQTRRVLKSQLPGAAEGYAPKVYWPARDTHMTSAITDPAYVQCEKPGDYDGQLCNGPRVRCPYGQPGDRLWMRETWMPDPPCDGTWGYTAWAGSRIGQIAAVPERFQHPAFCNYRASWLHGTDGLRWTPGIHMPRWASRITLEVTGVRVERLKDISEADAIAEGIEPMPGHDGWWRTYAANCVAHRDTAAELGHRLASASYASLWESINGPGSWAANPWVWVIEFKRLEAAC